MHCGAKFTLCFEKALDAAQLQGNHTTALLDHGGVQENTHSPGVQFGCKYVSTYILNWLILSMLSRRCLHRSRCASCTFKHPPRATAESRMKYAPHPSHTVWMSHRSRINQLERQLERVCAGADVAGRLQVGPCCQFILMLCLAECV